MGERVTTWEWLQDLYCRWCPHDCEDRKRDPLTLEERRGCVACSGFVDELAKSEKLVVLEEDQKLPNGVSWSIAHTYGLRRTHPLTESEAG